MVATIIPRATALSRAHLAHLSLLACFAHASLADEFSWEVSGATSKIESDELFDTDGSPIADSYVDSDAALIAATYYLDPIKGGEGPYELASFLNPTTLVTVAARHEKYASYYLGPGYLKFTFPGYFSRADEYAVGGRHVLRTSKWYFGGDFTKTNTQNPSIPSIRELDSSANELLAGKYLNSATSVQLSVTSLEQDTEREIAFCGLFCVTPAPLFVEWKWRSTSLSLFHLRSRRSVAYSLSATIAESSGDATWKIPSLSNPRRPGETMPETVVEDTLGEVRAYAVGGGVFPNQKLGVRLDYRHSDHQWSGEEPCPTPAIVEHGVCQPVDIYIITTTWFVSPQLGLEFVVSRATTDQANDIGGTGLRLIGRF